MAADLQALPIGAKVTVTEIIHDRLGGSKPGTSQVMEIGIREGKKVLYSLPWRSSFLPIRNYKKYIFTI